ncbi:hypothetical protein N0V94_008681 [Neodidymelliopsis sp. IMI 364377]|nr:hypothetical protein N0V94_008681 [Neodidymelliopsis sp. IMI 364377]
MSLTHPLSASLMPTQSAKIDPARKSILDLPADACSLIYSYAFTNRYGDTEIPLKIRYTRDDKFLIWCREHYIGGQLRRVPIHYTLLVLEALGLVSKAVRNEACKAFYAMTDVKFTDSGHEILTSVIRFLERIGPEGRSGLREWRCITQPVPNLGEYGYMTFQKLVGSLQMCRNLRSAIFDVTASQVLRGDGPQLRAYFMRHEPFIAPSLERLAVVLTSLPNLHYFILHLTPGAMRPVVPAVAATDDEDFLGFVFTGKREVVLWLKIVERFREENLAFEANDHRDDEPFIRTSCPDLRFHSYNDDELLDFEAWKEWRSNMVLGMTQWKLSSESQDELGGSLVVPVAGNQIEYN